jgi:hypothetical protein
MKNIVIIVCGKAIKHEPSVVSASIGNTVRLQDKSLTAGKTAKWVSLCGLLVDVV